MRRGWRIVRVPGGRRGCPEAALDELVEIVEAGPDVERDGVVRWRCADLAGVVADRFGVALSERSVERLLNDRGYGRLRPRPQHPKGDPEAQAAFKKTSPAR
ncbi:winged helix-turn-helix domain-containing protein [Amaricoccus sp.]|uniref:helix-turn-helix domain-containing protein n=1 Tax=Amaricoccus sp. TaxID=1872485 RepID=UPI0025C6DC96|nr:winged helix-turn-helix domain-containing protein [Amaricoccus sp.]